MFHAQCWGLPQVAIYARSKVVLPGRYSAEQIGILAQAMVDYDITVTNGAPAIFAPMLDYLKALPRAPDLSRALAPWLPVASREYTLPPRLMAMIRRTTPLLENLLDELRSLTPAESGSSPAHRSKPAT